jgi:DNA-binding LytR/AlgR family response regulator
MVSQMTAPRAIIAEDEPLLRIELREALATLWPDLRIVAEAADGIAATDALQRHAPDVLFLDIQMPGLSGLDVARAASGRCHVVFVTAYDAYAVTAFDEGAVDYVMKPLSPERLARAVGRVRARLREAPASLDGLLHSLAAQLRDAPRHLRWISVPRGQDVNLITVDEVLYFQSDNKYTRVATAQGESLIRKPMRELLDELDPAVFWQIHRGTLVNVNAIASVRRDPRGYLQVRLKDSRDVLAVSAAFAHRFRQM